MITAQQAWGMTLYATSPAQNILDDIDNNIQAAAENGLNKISYDKNVFTTDHEIKYVIDNLEQRWFNVWDEVDFLIIVWCPIKPI